MTRNWPQEFGEKLRGFCRSRALARYIDTTCFGVAMAGVELIFSPVLLAVKGLAFKYGACVYVCKLAFACTDILSFVLLSLWQFLKDVEVHPSAN